MYTRKTGDRYYFDTDGFEFESEIVDIVSRFAKRAWGNDTIKFATTQQDRYEGTDLFVLGIPTDFTLAFADKNKTRKLGDMVLDGVTVDFGVRFGNGKSVFQTPVLVMGVKTALGITRTNMWVALEAIKSNIQEILDTGMDKYFDATEAFGQ